MTLFFPHPTSPLLVAKDASQICNLFRTNKFSLVANTFHDNFELCIIDTIPLVACMYIYEPSSRAQKGIAIRGILQVDVLVAFVKLPSHTRTSIKHQHESPE